MCRCADPRRRERGVVLILAVFAVVLLTVLVVGIAAAVRVELMASRAGVTRMQALFLAQAGLNEARAVLVYDSQTLDALTDDWGPEAEDPLDLPRALGAGFYEVRVSDACGRIDINASDFTTLARLTGDEAVAAAIIDWRDADDELVTTEGAEANYYLALPHPYRPRNGPFETIGELLLVRGVTPRMFFGSDDKPGLAELVTVESLSPNTDPAGDARTSLNSFRVWGAELAFNEMIMKKLGHVLTEYEAAEIFRGLTELIDAGLEGYTSLAQLVTAAGLDPGRVAQLIDYVCIDPSLLASGKVNLNTAPLEVIAALPGSSEALAQAIMARRKEQPFQTLGEVVAFLMEQPGGLGLFQQMIDRVTTKSSSFIVEAMGWTEAGRTYRTLVALMRRTQDNVLVLRQAEEDWALPPSVQLPSAARR